MVVCARAFRPFWHDELYTYYIARAPNLGQLWEGLRLMDLNPPLSHAATRLSHFVFGTSEFATRLPSILAYFGASVCVFLLVRSVLSSLYGGLAVLLLWRSIEVTHATEARPYAFLLLFFLLAALCWRRAVESRPRKWALAVLAASVLGMLMSHVFAVLHLAPFAVAEAVRLRDRRRPDLPLWTALCLPCVSAVVYIPLIGHFNRVLFPQAYQVKLFDIPAFYVAELVSLLPSLAAVLVVVLLVRRRSPSTGPELKITIHSHEKAFVMTTALLPAIIAIVLLPSQGAFWQRYAVGASPVLGVALTWLLASKTGGSRKIAAAASLVLIAFCLAASVPAAFRSVGRGPIQPTAAFDRFPKDLPVVAASGLTFLEMDHYESRELIARLYYLTDRESAIRYANATLFEDAEIRRRCFPIRAKFARYREFVKTYSRFLVYGTEDHPEDWLLRVLRHDGAQLRKLGEFKSYYKDRDLYEVTIPAP